MDSWNLPACAWRLGRRGGLLAGGWRTAEQPLEPRHLPVSLRIVYRCKPVMVKGYLTGTAEYTFTNSMPFPVTVAFPPICYYTYGSNWHESPFPDGKRKLPDFARRLHEVTLSPGEARTFASPVEMLVKGDAPELNEAFVFGMPGSPREHPVVGTVYGTVEFEETVDTK